MFEKIILTGKVCNFILEEDFLSILLSSKRLSRNKEGLLLSTEILFTVRLYGASHKETATKIKEGDLIGLEGVFTGTSSGNPVILDDDTAAFNLKTYSVRRIGIATDDPAYSDLQTVVLVGHLGRDPEARYTPDGAMVVSTSLATSRKEANEASTNWWRLSVWEKKAEAFLEYLHKGEKLFVVGLLNVDPATGGPRVWVDKDGLHRASFELTVTEYKMLGSKKDGVSAAPSSATYESTEDIPF